MSPTASAKPATTSAPSLDSRALFYMFLLALQFGFQPALTRQFTPSKINRSTVILVQELMKFCFASFMLRLSCTDKQLAELKKQWTPGEWFQVAAVPALLYAVQNVAALTAYQHLDALTFNVLNQTKTLSAALCCYVVMGRSQSMMQVVALLLLLASALVMEGVVPLSLLGLSSSSESEKPLIDDDTADDTTATTNSAWDTQHVTHGVLPILVASFISGLAGALSQKNLQSAGGGRNPYQFSMELCAASAVMLGLKLVVNSTGLGGSSTAATAAATAHEGMWDGWTPATLIPIATNAAGGIVVGLVTKYAGSVRKGFALIFGIFLSGLVQEFVTHQGEKSVRPEQVVGGLLAAISLYLHATNPPRSSSSMSTTKPSTTVEDKKKTN